MEQKMKKILYESNYSHGFDCSTLGYMTTGIKKIIVCPYSYGDKELKDTPKIAVGNKYNRFDFDDFFTIEINTLNMDGEIKITGKELTKVLEWVKLNRKALIWYWKVGNEELTRKFFEKLKSIKG